MIDAPSPEAIATRSVKPEDQSFLLELYKSSRGDDLRGLGWDEQRISEFLDMRLMLSPPRLITGEAVIALSTLGDHAPRVESPILCVETEFFLEEPSESLHGFFLLVPDPKAFDAIFRAVRVE